MKVKFLLKLIKTLAGLTMLALPVRGAMLYSGHDGGFHIPGCDELIRYIMAWLVWAASVFKRVAGAF